MKVAIILVLTFLYTSIFSQNTNTSLNPVLLYPQASFDSDTCCWRKLSANKKYLDAANHIVSYLKTNSPTNRHSLNWHAGQMFAMAHSDKWAKKYFRKTYSGFYKWFGNTDAKTWYYYAKGTIAFIENDKKSLDRIIRKWRAKFPVDKNFEALVGLNENWGKGYFQY